MRELDLSWVADEVEEAVRAGRVDILDAPRARDRGALELELPELAGVPSVQAVRTAFPPGDRLQLALGALRRVVIDTAAMEADVRTELGGPTYTVDDDPDAVSRQVVRDNPMDPETLERLRRLLT